MTMLSWNYENVIGGILTGTPSIWRCWTAPQVPQVPTSRPRPTVRGTNECWIGLETTRPGVVRGSR